MQIEVVIVEDDKATRQLVVEILGERGYSVSAFARIQTAREHLEERAPNLVITDVMLPDGSGLELISRLPDLHAERIPVLVLSGCSSESDILRGYAAGADDYMTKPFSPAELLAKVSVLLARFPRVTETTSPAQEDLPRKDGLIFGRYEAAHLLGQGAYGKVYEAHDRVERRQVALKVLTMLAGRRAENRLRFLRETYALSGVHHPNVVRVLDFGLAEGRLYYAMELVKGPTLAHEVRAQPLSEDEVVRLLIPLADALEAMRQSDLIHRDIKPANIVLRAGLVEQPVLIDFGLSKHPFDRGLTDPGLLMGTPGFMPPEVYAGQDHDHCSDLWALGMVARFALCGREVWQDLEPYELFERLSAQAVPLPPLESPALSALLERLLEREPALRYATAAELLRDLKAMEPDASLPALPGALNKGSD